MYLTCLINTAMAKSNETKSSGNAESFKCDQCDKVSYYILLDLVSFYTEFVGTNELTIKRKDKIVLLINFIYFLFPGPQFP